MRSPAEAEDESNAIVESERAAPPESVVSLPEVLEQMGEAYRSNPVLAVRGQAFIKYLHRYVGSQLEARLTKFAVKRGIKVVYESTVLGSTKPKDVDVAIIDPHNGPLVLVGIRSQMSSVAKLDFIHLKQRGRQGKLRQISAKTRSVPMPTLPKSHDSLIQAFAPHFSNCIWQHAQVLLLGATHRVAPGRRTVTAVLRIMGLSAERHFQSYHRVLNRAVWSSWALSRTLLKLLVQTFVPKGPIICGLDDTIERRRGVKIKARGIYRDPVRSSHGHFVKASGLRWVSLMLLAPIPWAGRTWALPFLTCLAPSERFYQGKARAHKKLTDWARQMVMQLRRWLPERQLVVVADSSFAAILWLFQLSQLPGQICLIVRFRFAKRAALYEPAPEHRRPGQRGRTPIKGKRLPTLEQVAQNRKTKWKRVAIPDWYGQGTRRVETHAPARSAGVVSDTAVWYHSGLPPLPIRWVLIRDPKGKFKTQALLSTDLNVAPVQIIKWFVLRWQLEVTYHEVREHLGVETQRQWSDLAILRTTPALLGLFSLVTLLAHQHAKRRKLPIRPSARRPGITRPNRPSVMPWRWSAGKFGSTSVFGCPLRTPIALNVRPGYRIGCFQPCVTHLDSPDWIKSS